MRLLHTSTLTFREFLGAQIPPYAILSHRWGEDEVTHKEMRRGTATAGASLDKIHNFARLAESRDLKWCWIDACCIDKRSSSELTEAINSMYKWYANCTECYVYLNDVGLSPQEVEKRSVMDTDDPDGELPDRSGVDFSQSAWFSRGWTLQELLAPNPTDSCFSDVHWNHIGKMIELIDEIAVVTGIAAQPLRDFHVDHPDGSSTSACVATKMSWTSRRRTTREEDMAYCLLGLFNVNMPLLYGEGATKAFRRLQLEIMVESVDETLFAWTSENPICFTILAPSPAEFAHSADILPLWITQRPSYSVTNKGLRIALPKRHLAQG